jgi:hypothetical protein
MTDQEVLQAYIDRHNEGVESGDFGHMLELFAPNAELLFVAISVGPFRGRDAIEQAFATRPPLDKLRAAGPMPSPSGASVTYAWETNPGAKAGTIEASIDNGLIVRMVIYFDLV